MSEFFPKPNSFGENVKVGLDLSNHVTNIDSKNATRVDTSSFAKKNVFFEKLEIYYRKIR